VVDALHNDQWISDIRGATSIRQAVDTFTWRLNPKGNYTAGSAYLVFFMGSIPADYANTLWKSRAPPKQKILYLACNK
jgi:hypothetical protein